tara:strand:- start:13398 stop:13718 length:321 start_codon:yes stop_codon:yes gene_type:complete
MDYEGLRRSFAKGLLSLIVDNGYKFELECEGEELLDPTSDISAGVDMMFEVDECTIYVLDKDGEASGWVWWMNCNDWDESISDYTMNLETKLNILEWSDKFLGVYR